MERENGRTQEWQEWMLGRLVDKVFVRQTSGVKGAYTTGSYVIWLLNEIFGPANWTHHVIGGPELVTYGESQGYSQVTVRLTVTFADGSIVTHDDIGIWPFSATDAKRGGTLDGTAPERYEQVIKSAVTDGVKACTEYLGTCFRPLADKELEGFLTRRLAKQDLKAKGISTEGESGEKSKVGLFGDKPNPLADPVVEAAKDMGGVVSDEPEIPRTLVPRTVTELYKWGEDQLGVPIKDAVGILEAYLMAKHGSDSIGAYIKNGGSDALATLWAVLLNRTSEIPIEEPLPF